MSDRLMELHEKCPRIGHALINNIINTPVLIDAVLAYDGEYDDEIVCEIVYGVAKKISYANPNAAKVARTARRIYKKLYGTLPVDLYINDMTASDFPGYEQVFEILEPLTTRSKRILLGNSEFLAAVDSHHPENFLQMYAVFKLVFFEMIRKQYKKKDAEKRNTYFGFRDVADNFCWVIFGDPTVWREQLQAKLN